MNLFKSSSYRLKPYSSEILKWKSVFSLLKSNIYAAFFAVLFYYFANSLKFTEVVMTVF